MAQLFRFIWPINFLFPHTHVSTNVKESISEEELTATGSYFAGDLLGTIDPAKQNCNQNKSQFSCELFDNLSITRKLLSPNPVES